jgi:flavocytochrome c
MARRLCTAPIALACAALAATAMAGAPDVGALQLSMIGELARQAGDQAALEARLEAMLGQLRAGTWEIGADGRAAPAVGSAAAPVAVIGGGLSGLTASLKLLQMGHDVLLVDKASFFGGNSAKASSGINGGLTAEQRAADIGDSADTFYNDTLVSSQREPGSYTARLARKMADESAAAIGWLQKAAKIETPDVGQLGGHSIARTHRPRGRLSGAAFISGLERAIGKHAGPGRLTVHKGVALEAMEPLPDGAGWQLALRGVAGGPSAKRGSFSAGASSVILATGGFGADKSKSGLLAEVAPNLLGIATTNGAFATGDGIKLARELGAGTVDLDMVQVHPTGFSEVPAGFKDTGGERPLILCAEILRGVGSVLLEKGGARFVNELDTRKAVTAAMDAKGQRKYVLALPPAAAKQVEAHVHIYGGKALLHKVSGAAGVAAYIAKHTAKVGGDAAAVAAIEASVAATFASMSAGTHPVPRGAPTTLPAEGDYHVGLVQPVLHYTMGGLGIEADTANVLDANGTAMAGLYAAGEIIGGVHGVNRLGGSSLLDCVVFGLVAAQAAGARAAKLAADAPATPAAVAAVAAAVPAAAASVLDGVPASERKHVKLGKQHFDISQFVALHPGGAIEVEKGEDLTERFTAAHGEDWELLERHEIVSTDESGAEVAHKGNAAGEVKKEHHLANYGGKGGSWREIVGRHSWFLIHSMAAKFPEYPTAADRAAMRGFIAALGQLYPCKLCRKHLQQQLRDAERELGPVNVDSRTGLTTWVCQMHNIVNRDIGKPLFDCTPIVLDMMYLKNCGECEVEPKGKKKVDPKTLSGYHPTSGPWDYEFYLPAPELLGSITKKSDLWKAKKVVEMSELLSTLKVAKNVTAVRAALLSGPQSKDKAKKVKAAFAKATKALKDALGPALLKELSA